MSEAGPDSPREGEESTGPPVEIPRSTDLSSTHNVCPHCGTANRLTFSQCVHCGRDISMLRVIANKARHHFNAALEHAERGRWDEAAAELRQCVEFDANHVNAWVVLGTCLSKLERFDEARDCWQRALDIDPRFAKAHDYLGRVENVGEARRYYRRLRQMTIRVFLLLALILALLAWQLRPNVLLDDLRAAERLCAEGRHGEALEALQTLAESARAEEIIVPAQALMSAIDAEFRLAMDGITHAQDDGDWRRGLTACDRLEALQPRGALHDLMVHHRGEFAARLIGEARDRLDDLHRGAATAGAVFAELSEFTDLMPNEVLRSEMDALAASAEAVHNLMRAEEFAARLAAVKSEFAEAPPRDQIAALVDLLAEWRDQPALGELITARAGAIAAEAERQWTAAQASAEATRALIAELEGILASAEISANLRPSVSAAMPDLLDGQGRIAALAPLDALRSQAREALPRLEFEVDLHRFQALVDAETWDEALEALGALDLSQATDEERAQLARQGEELTATAEERRRAQLLDLFERLLEHDRAIDGLAHSEALAREALDGFEDIIERVPDSRFYRGFRVDYALFYAARSAERLGQTDRAIELYERLLEQAPGGDHVRQVRRLLERIRPDEPA